MKRIPLFLVLTLAAAWGYTSWYWYTCNIKGACQQNLIQEQIPETRLAENIMQDSNSEEINDREIREARDSGDEIQSLSRGDVLVWNSVIPQAPTTQEDEEEIEEDTSLEESDETDSKLESASGTTLESESSSWSTLSGWDDEVTTEDTRPTSINLCVNPLVWPISLSWGNTSSEVLKLETFLIANAYLWSSDGVYWNADFEAVKQLQLDYKEQMLDPWGIEAPTGYVWSTTVATINSIWCKN